MVSDFLQERRMERENSSESSSEQILEIEREILGRPLNEQAQILTRKLPQRVYDRPRRYDEEY